MTRRWRGSVSCQPSRCFRQRVARIETVPMQTPNILQFECRRCQVIHVSPFTERRAEDEVLSYSGCCAQSFLNLGYCHSRWQIPLETVLVDEFWAG